MFSYSNLILFCFEHDKLTSSNEAVQTRHSRLFAVAVTEAAGFSTNVTMLRPGTDPETLPASTVAAICVQSRVLSVTQPTALAAVKPPPVMAMDMVFSAPLLMT